MKVNTHLLNLVKQILEEHADVTAAKTNPRIDGEHAKREAARLHTNAVQYLVQQADGTMDNHDAESALHDVLVFFTIPTEPA